ncbi:hypothetical protein ACOMHN_003019 [Nucella lapillus]
MASGRRRVADDGRQTLGKIRQAVQKGNVDIVFEDRNFVYELIDALYEDGVDVAVKTEFLAVLEQYGLDHLDAENAGQVTQRLLDVLQDQRGGCQQPRFTVQLMLTLTALIVTNDMMRTELCGSLVAELWRVVSGVNDVATRQLRGCSCQCLRQLEAWRPVSEGPRGGGLWWGRDCGGAGAVVAQGLWSCGGAGDGWRRGCGGVVAVVGQGLWWGRGRVEERLWWGRGCGGGGAVVGEWLWWGSGCGGGVAVVGQGLWWGSGCSGAGAVVGEWLWWGRGCGRSGAVVGQGMRGGGAVVGQGSWTGENGH